MAGCRRPKTPGTGGCMAEPLRDVTILGLHPVELSPELFDQAVELQWGTDLTGDELRDARRQVEELFASLHLVEVRLDPPGAEVDWGAFTQAQDGVDESEWQVAYDEQPVGDAGTWTFFLHQ